MQGTEMFCAFAPRTGPTQSPKPVDGSGADAPRSGARATIRRGAGKPEGLGVDDESAVEVREAPAELGEMVMETEVEDAGTIRTEVNDDEATFPPLVSDAESVCISA